MLFGRRKPGFVKEEEVRGGPVEAGASASVGSDGVVHVDSKPGQGQKPEEGSKAEEGRAVSEGEGKKELFSYLTELPDVEDPFEGIEPPPAPETEQAELTQAQKLAAFIRSRSAGGSLTSYKMLRDDDEQIDELLGELGREEGCGDIVTVRGSKDIYYYSNQNMSDNYAMIAMYVEEKDLAVTLSQMVRFNCKTYPAVTPLEYFEKHPYFYTPPQIERALALIRGREDCRDIHEIKNSQGKRFLFSDTYMTPVYARALSEPEEFTD